MNFNNQQQVFQWNGYSYDWAGNQIMVELVIYKNNPLGQGGFGTVYKGLYNKQEVAVKELKYYLDNNNTVNEYYQQEINTCNLIKQITCENIVRVLDVIVLQGNNALVIMDLCDSDLLKKRKESPDQRLDPITTLTYIKQIALGINSLHDINITHRDIKPDNIFMGYNQNRQQICKVGDFGLGKRTEIMITKVGTLSYMAPDMLDLTNLQYSNKVDIWAIGVMTHELLTGCILFQGQTPDIIRNCILNSRNYKEWYKAAINNFSNDYITKSFKFIQHESIINLIDMMLQKRPQDRIDIKQLIQAIDECMYAVQNTTNNINNSNNMINNNNNNNNNNYFNNSQNNNQQYPQNQLSNNNNNQRQQVNQQDSTIQYEKKAKELENMMQGQKIMFEKALNNNNKQLQSVQERMSKIEQNNKLESQLNQQKLIAFKHLKKL
ncbi:hypothetical protein ABPG74_011570 [Tetrahymena malaccensis]